MKSCVEQYCFTRRQKEKRERSDWECSLVLYVLEISGKNNKESGKLEKIA